MKLPVKLTRPTTPDTFRSLIHRLDDAMEQIRQRAFEIFQETGKDAHLENWFKAERDLFCVPAAEMKETETELQLRVAVPGFAAENLEVSILPEMITVEGEVTEKKEEKTEEETTVFSELNERRLFRQFTLPKPILTDEAKAVLENGYLVVTAHKAKVEPMPTKVPVTAASKPAAEPEKAMAAARS